MAAKKPPKKGKGPAAAKAKKKSSRGRVNKAVDVLQSSIDRWSEYAVDSARLASSGDLNPGAWAKVYAKMWGGLADDLGRLTKLIFPKQG